MSWERQAGEVDIEILDCSTGGLRIVSPAAIPEGVNLRIRVASNLGREEVMTARMMWQEIIGESSSLGVP